MSPDPRPLRECLAAYVAELVATAPPLTPDQRDRLAVLLRDTRTPAPGSPSPVAASAGTAFASVLGQRKAPPAPP